MHEKRNVLQRAEQYQNLLNLIGEQQSNGEAERPTLKAAHMRSIVNSHRLAQAYSEESKVAYVSEQFPTELTFAFDVIPWNIESMAIMLAQSLDVTRVFQLTQEHHLSRDICSFLRGPYGMMLADCYPRPDLVLTNDQPCEGLSKLEYMTSKHYQAPFLALHTPNSVDEDSLAYLVKQMRQLLQSMATELGVKLDPEVLQAVIRCSNEAKRYYCKTARLLEDHALPGVARELQEIFGMNYFGVEATLRICKMLYEEALELSQQAPSTAKAKRVLWVGQVPEGSHELLRDMERQVEILFWAPLWEANWITLDEERPLRSIAERAILYHWNDARIEADVAQLCERYHVDGLLISNVWGCRNVMGVSSALRDLAKSRKLKYLKINIDLVDRNNYAYTNVKNRLDAFLEILQ